MSLTKLSLAGNNRLHGDGEIDYLFYSVPEFFKLTPELAPRLDHRASPPDNLTLMGSPLLALSIWWRRGRGGRGRRGRSIRSSPIHSHGEQWKQLPFGRNLGHLSHTVPILTMFFFISQIGCKIFRVFLKAL
jgi:hypothetical protein